MPSIKTELEDDIGQLIGSRYTMPPKVFEKEELAVQQTLQKMLHVMQQPAGQHSLIPDIPIDALEDMTKRGQLTLIAEHLGDSFLPSLETAIKDSSASFEMNGEHITLAKLYHECKHGLLDDAKKARQLQALSPAELKAMVERKLAKQSGGEANQELVRKELEALEIKMKAKLEPDFGDILLRMYTSESPFYKKINAILAGYNNPATTTPEEKKLSLLLNVAIHKAGIEKRKHEIQKTPEILFRGQNRGFADIQEKFERTKMLHASGKLSDLSPTELANINIVDIASKKTLSTTSEIGVAVGFTWNAPDAVVLHVKNPEELADYYNVQNISAIKGEAEFISRIPDDIVMIPVNITKKGNIHHVEVVCIRSANVILQNSAQYSNLHNAIKDLIGKAEKETRENSGWFSMSSAATLTAEQMSLMKSLDRIIDVSQKKSGTDSIEDQEAFLNMAGQVLIKLYQTNPNAYQKATFDTIKAKLQDYSAVFADLNVVHEKHDLHENIALEHTKIKSIIEGKKTWLTALKRTAEEASLLPIAHHLAKLVDEKATDATQKDAATHIIQEIQANNHLSRTFPTLQQSMKELVGAIDKISDYQKAWVESQPPASSTSVTSSFKSRLQMTKSMDTCDTPSEDHNVTPTNDA